MYADAAFQRLRYVGEAADSCWGEAASFIFAGLPGLFIASIQYL